VFVADVSKAELSSALFEDANGARALRKLLRGEQSPGAWSLVVGLYSFMPNETPFIASVATLAREIAVPWVSSAHASFAGTSTFAEGADLDDWDKTPLVDWDAFRHGADAKWISLTIPRILLRVPYGKSSDECSVIRFEETDQGELAHDQYLWGNGALLCAALLGDAAASDSPAPTQGVVSGLPLHVAKVDGLPEVKPSTEAVIAQRALAHLLDRGLTVLACERDGSDVRIPRLQSIAHPPARLEQAGGAR
jgi:predicted component of type VI protein secretion system